MIFNKDEIELIKRRYNSCVKRSIGLHVSPPLLDDFIRLFIKSKNKGFLCFYCGVKLKWEDKKPYYSAVPSVDHKKPLGFDGNNDFVNLALCCHRCNIIKGTMSDVTYLKLLDYIKEDSKLMDSIFNEIHLGRFADTLSRLDNEKRCLD